MEKVIESKQADMDSRLQSSINNAAAIITKSYLERLEDYSIVEPSEEDIDIDISKCGRFYRLSKLVINKDENFLNKLTTVIKVASSINCTISTIVHSNGRQVDYLIGIVSKNARKDDIADQKRRAADAKAFFGALSGNLTGSEFTELSSEAVADFRKTVLERPSNCYSAVSGIVSLRDENDKSIEKYVQGIENLTDSLCGQKYTIVMIADPIRSSEIQVRKQGYEILYTELVPFLKSALTLNESDTLSLTKARTEGISEGISKGISLTQSQTKSKGFNIGVNSSVGVNFGISANFGISGGINRGTTDMQGKTEAVTNTQQKNTAVTNTAATGKTSGKSLQLNSENRTIRSLLERIDRQIKRLDECDSFGAFDCAAYVIADCREDALTVASNYHALMCGHNSNIQVSKINTWYKPESTKALGTYISSLVHPRFRHDNEDILVTPASIVSGNEIAIQFGLPQKSILGVSVIPMAPFGRNVLPPDKKSIMIGSLYHMGRIDGNGESAHRVGLDIESLSTHTFVTGSTGAGKSTFIYTLLDKLKNTKSNSSNSTIKFMVIEPAKGEYKDRFGSYPDVKVFGTNCKRTPLLKINPFSFPNDVHVLEHIDRLIDIFNVCWPMYAAMPAVLKDAVERAYIAAGWRLDTSECKYQSACDEALYPTFSDVLFQINAVINDSEYSSDSKGDYKGALSTRIKSLTNGLYNQIFSGTEIPASELFDANAIVDLSRIGSSETKSLIMGLLIMKLQEYRMSCAKTGNSALRHITVLEEAHNLLKRTSTEQSAESANLTGKSVEMLANSIAEMRTYGEGFIIADQAPGLIDLSAIRNTNTKIVLRLPDLSDRELVGNAANLNQSQIHELSRLNNFVAAVYQNNWIEPVLCKLDADFVSTVPYRKAEIDVNTPDRTKEKIVKYLLIPFDSRHQLDDNHIDMLTHEVFASAIPAQAKVAYMQYIHETDKRKLQALRGQILSGVFNTTFAFSNSRRYESDIPTWYESMCRSLEPDLSLFDIADRQKILAALTKERADTFSNSESISLFERLMDFY